jgi:threonine/homoserine/homoserine lactone efflux protein
VGTGLLLWGAMAAAGLAGRLLARPQVQVWLDRITATTFLGFGLRLATETRP